MKKISVLSIFCLMLCMGFLLGGCGDTFTVSVSKEASGAELYNVVLNANKSDQAIEDEYTFQKGTDIIVIIRATKNNTDFSDLVVKVNDEEKTIFLYQNFSLADGRYNYGYFIIPKINKDAKLSFSGVKVKTE